ncbi:hypothetical protein BDV95DRAFT_626504 [Massariosphaeria phaeospora]|uniref:Nitrogen regulatory protein areA GATA-like domain-containing protein n=1 Tax=Massariosphaeria phaeospora TaxID=100035 RepID=A0A7C8MTZ9_9PLEO|nr:hypothetical protein BDV95DRAFT_626504 [Massariosphaeria phaeospora]
MAEVLSHLPEGSPFAHGPLRSSSSHTSFFDAGAAYTSARKNNYSHSDLLSPPLSSSHASSFRSTPSSSLSLNTKFDSSSDDEDGIVFPAYSLNTKREQGEEPAEVPPSSPVRSAARLPPSPSPADSVPRLDTPVTTPDPLPTISEDDTAVRPAPSQHVDYLSYEWREEDIWSSWRHIVGRRSIYGERSRLENASWRTWAKNQFKLQTVSPETLNWLKDYDVTWLYGPLQPASSRLMSQNDSEPVSRLSKTNSFLHKKPILKKRSMSEVMLQNSISSSSLVKQAAAAVHAQQVSDQILERRRVRPVIGRATSDYISVSIPSWTSSQVSTTYFSSQSTSGLVSPADHHERRHIRFDDNVEQCIAVDCKDADDEEEEDFNHNPWAKYRDDDESSDEGVVMMKRSRKKRPLSRTSSKASISGESKIIAKLPSTTLKYRTDSPDVTEQHQSHSRGFWRSSGLSPSPSQETLRPSNPSTNFLLPEDDNEENFSFNAFATYDVKQHGTPTPSDPNFLRPSTPPGGSSETSGLRRTPSGMLMAFDEMDDDPAPPGIIGRVVDTVNTARDIAHVIWNVGWRN